MRLLALFGSPVFADQALNETPTLYGNDRLMPNENGVENALKNVPLLLGEFGELSYLTNGDAFLTEREVHQHLGHFLLEKP
jgi:hypothetical protein